MPLLTRSAVLWLLSWFYSSSAANKVQLIQNIPHPENHSTQGLVIKDGVVYESSGGLGQSFVVKWDLLTGAVISKAEVTPNHYAQGLTLMHDSLFLLTWKSGVAFELDKETLRVKKQFKHDRETWGLTHNGEHLIVSDGSDYLQYIDPETFRVVKRIRVRLVDQSIYGINELEWINNRIWANLHQTDFIVVINPTSGWVEQRFYLPDLLNDRDNKPGLLNGIAFDEAQNKIWITGKLWPILVQIMSKTDMN